MTSPTGPSEFTRPLPAVDLGPIFSRLLAGETLSEDEAAAAFRAMITGAAHEAEIGALLALLATRTPTAAELVGAAGVMRQHVDAVPTRIDPDQLVDTAGTGGAPKTFNVSTAAAILAAACGVRVAKHGNRSRTGRGSAEVLQQLGVNVNASRLVQARCLDEVGVCFCFAIHHHPATRHVIGARRALGFATMFNLLGPLTNPAGARRQVMGVYADRYVTPVAQALQALGASRAIVMHSRDGLDEMTVTAETRVAHITPDGVSEEIIQPESLGLTRATFDDVRVTDIEAAAQSLRSILCGEERGARRDMTLLSTAAVLVVAERADSFAAGLTLAAEAIDDGRAAATLEALIECSNHSTDAM